jgi:LEA14-like dessication related protein
MNKNFLLGIAAAAAAAYYFLIGKKQAIENLLIKPIDIAINSSKTNILKLVFNLKLQITNSSNFTVKINKIDVDILVNNRIISEFQKNLPIIIAPNKTEIVLIEITAQNAAIITTIIDIITSGEKITAGVKGVFSTDLGIVNIDYTKTV